MARENLRLDFTITDKDDSRFVITAYCDISDWSGLSPGVLLDKGLLWFELKKENKEGD